MAETIIGYTQLRARIAAISGPNLGPALMKTLGMATVCEAKLLVPRKTGNLARSIHVANATPTSVDVIAATSYARYVERGTGPHEITPNAKKALAFASQGIVNERFGPQPSIFRLSGSIRVGALRKFGNAAFIVVKKVHHPGTRAHPFLMPGAQAAAAKSGLRDRIVAAWNDAA